MSRIEEQRDIWWDLYKDAHGVRPRGIDTTGWDEKDFDQELNYLQGCIDVNHAARLEDEARAAAAFEQRIVETVALGAWTRDNAVRWIHEAEDTQGDDEYLCFRLGLRYGYFKQAA